MGASKAVSRVGCKVAGRAADRDGSHGGADGPTRACASGPGGPERGEIGPRAADLLKRMSDYLMGLKAFSFRATATDVMLATGQKLQFGGVSLSRPLRLAFPPPMSHTHASWPGVEL